MRGGEPVQALNDGSPRVGDLMKIEGPYRKNSGWRCRILTPDGVRKWCATGKTPEEAVLLAEQFVAAGGQRTLSVQSETHPSDPAQPDTPEPHTSDRKAMGPMRIEGPYRHRAGYRCRVVTPTGRVWCTPGRTEQHAWKIAEAFAGLAARQGRHSVRDALAAYAQHQRDKGNREQSVQNTGQVLARFFGKTLDVEMAKLTPQRGIDLYERLHTQKSPRTGKPLAADSHRNYLAQAKTFLSWCVSQGWLKWHPLEKVRGTGRRSHGKTQLTIDEARRLYRHCLKLADKDDGALAVLMALSMGMRASEITSRTVRDLDDAGRLLRVEANDALDFKPKTKASRRPVPVPSSLQAHIKARTRAKLPTALLFISEKTGGAHWRDWVAEQARHHCREAGVPVVCAHALRGVAATSAVEAGIAAEAVAKLLGHESTSMTRQSYIAPGTLEQAEREQVQQVLSES